eukprot:212460_1
MPVDSLDELSASWQLESDYPYFRGIASLFVSCVSLFLLISLIYKTIKISRDNPNNKPDICKYCSICCGSKSSNYFQCKNLCILPAPLDVCICAYFLGFLTFGCNSFGIIKYGNWIDAQNYTLGYIALIIFAVLIGFVSLCVYMYFYSMLILTISSAGDDFAISNCTKRIHTIFMITAAICFPIGNIMMEIYGQDFGRNFRIGQVLAYTSFACIFLGISHLILLLIKRLEKVLVNSMSSDMIGSPLTHFKTRTQIRQDIDNLTKSNMDRDAQLIQVITKMLVITITIILISCISGILTAYRYYWGQQKTVAKILSLVRWFWFTIVNISFGAFIVYLTIGFNIHLYKYWCRCDKTIHKCVMCCVKRETMKKITIAQSQSINEIQSNTPISNKQNGNNHKDKEPTANKMVSYSSVHSGSTSNAHNISTVSTIKENNNVENATQEIEMNNLSNNNEKNKREKKGLHTVQVTDSNSIVSFMI